MKTFEQLRRYIKENIPDPFDTKKGEGPDFEKELKKTKSKGIKTYKQKSLDLYKSGGPFVPEKEVSQTTGKTVKMEKKPYFGKKTLPQTKQKAPDRTGLKKTISDIRASDKRLYDAGVGKKPSLVQQRKYTKERIKQLSRQTTRQDAMNRASGNYGSTEGTAGASGSSKTVTPTKPQKSASATDFTKKINQANKNRKEFTGNKKSFQAFKKQADAASDKLVSKREVVRSTTGTKDVKQLRDINKQIKSTERISKGYDLASKGKGNVKNPIVKASDLKPVTDNTAKVTASTSKPPEGKALTAKNIEKKLKSKVSPTTQYRRTVSKKYGIKPKNILSKTQKSILKQKRLAQRDVVKAAIGPQNRAFFKKAIALPGAKKAAPVIKALAKAGPVGRVAAAVGTVAALSPAARKGMSNFAKRALTGAGLGGVIGGAAASQKETDKKRIKDMEKPVFVKGSKKVEKGLNLNLSDTSKPKDKPRTSQSIATEVDYLKKRQKVAPYGAKYTG